MLGPAHPLLKEFGCSSAILTVPFTSCYCRMNHNNYDEASDDITGFGRGLPMLGFYGGWNPGLQPYAQQYPFFQGGWTVALNQGFMPLQLQHHLMHPMLKISLSLQRSRVLNKE